VQPDREPIVVACTADQHYLMPLAVTLTSLVARLDSRRALSIYVIDGGIPRADRTRLADSLRRPNVRIHWIPGRSTLRPELPVWGRLQPSVYERLAIADYLPDTVRKAIWLDCDLVIERDLAQLWDTDIGDRHVLAVQDMIVPYVSSPMGVARHAALGIPASAKYFNAGVMVVNLALWREHGIAERVMAYLESYWDDVVFLEQEGLNAVLAGKWEELDPRWNQNAGVSGRSFYSSEHLDEATYARVVNDPWIVHFTGNLKPWGIYRDPRSRALYFHYLDRTPWAGYRPRRRVAGLLLAMYESARLRNVLYPLEKRGLQLARRVSRWRSDGPPSGRVTASDVEVVTGGG
jgi:lipopolysaccharide biosynthesis glycosyltransferase